MSPSSLTSRVRRVALSASALLFATCTNDPIQTGADRLAGPMAAIGVDPESGATIETNKDDYQPGEVVHVEGRGWAPNETVVLFMTEEPDTHEDVTQEVQADGDGKFSIHFYDVQEHDLGVTFTLTATGLTSASVAIAVFTDNIPAGQVTVMLDGATAVTVAPGATISLEVEARVSTASGGPVNWNSTGWEITTATTAPAGKLANCVDTGNAPGTGMGGTDYTRTFNITAPLVAATYNLWVALDEDDGTGANACGGPVGQSVKKIFGDVVTVQAANTAPTVSAGADATINEGATFSQSGSFTDPNANTWTGTVDYGDGTGVQALALNPDKTFSLNHTYADNGVYTVTVTVNDGTANGTDEVQVTVNNVSPVVNAGPDANMPGGGTFSQNGSFTDPGADTWTGTVDYGDGSGVQALTLNPDKTFALSHTYASSGQYTVKVTVKDDDDGEHTDEVVVNVGNTPPSVNAGGPYTVAEGSEITLSPTVTDPDVTDVLAYKWTVNTTGIDGGGVCTFDDDSAKNAKVTCTDDSQGAPGGKFTLTLEVKDGTATVTHDADLTVTNMAPTANAGGPYSGNEGSAIQLNGTGDDEGDNDVPHLTYAWSVVTSGIDTGGGCSFDDASKKDAKVTCTDDSNADVFKLKLVVGDDDGGTSAVSYADLTVNNVNPTANAAGSYSGDEGSPVQLNGTGDDAGTNDVPDLTYKWTISTTGIDAGGACTFDDDTKKDAKVTCTDDGNGGTFQLTLVVKDDDGGTSTASYANLTVANVNPTANPGGPYNGSEGSPVSLTGSKTDPGSNDTHTYEWSYAAHSGVDAGASCAFSNAAILNPTITCNDDGIFKVTLKVTDDDNGSHSADAYVTLTNQPPVITGVSLNPTTSGLVYPLNGQPKVEATWTDAGTNDTHSCTYEIKDAVLNTVISSGLACGTHMNATVAGLFLITVSVTDDDTGSDSEGFPTGGALIVIYDPSAGFVTGGGWIDSPAGACQYGACGYNTVGKATFGFVSKYLKGASIPTGNTEFQFHAGDLNFKSTSYDWLVVSQNGARAQYKGYGSVNGVTGYGFLLTALDETQDKFRIKIWSTTSNQVVYDNRMGSDDTSSAATVLGGGSIIIHVPKK